MDNGSQPLIRLDNVSKVFVTDEVETHALSSVHFDVKKGEYLSIAGPSGCGKSSLVRAGVVPALLRRGQPMTSWVPPPSTNLMHSLSTVRQDAHRASGLVVDQLEEITA